jgi:hypothetical protein
MLRLLWALVKWGIFSWMIDVRAFGWHIFPREWCAWAECTSKECLALDDFDAAIFRLKG